MNDYERLKTEEDVRRELDRIRSEIEDLLGRDLDSYLPAVVFRPEKP